MNKEAVIAIRQIADLNEKIGTLQDARDKIVYDTRQALNVSSAQFESLYQNYEYRRLNAERKD